MVSEDGSSFIQEDMAFADQNTLIGGATTETPQLAKDAVVFNADEINQTWDTLVTEHREAKGLVPLTLGVAFLAATLAPSTPREPGRIKDGTIRRLPFVRQNQGAEGTNSTNS